MWFSNLPNRTRCYQWGLRQQTGAQLCGEKKIGRSINRPSLPTDIHCRRLILSSSSDYLQLPALWRGTESHSGGGESFSPSELLVFPSSCPEPLGRNFANTDGLLSINLLFGPIKTKEEKQVCGWYTEQLSSRTRLGIKHSRGVTNNRIKLLRYL